jgi:hypothetical protein
MAIIAELAKVAFRLSDAPEGVVTARELGC